MGRKRVNNPQEVRIKLSEESREKLDAINPNLHITNQIRDTIEYAYNSRYFGKVDAVEIDRFGGGSERLMFVTESSKNKVEYVSYLCEKIIFYPYAGYFDIKVKLTDALMNVDKIQVSKFLEKLLVDTRIRKEFLNQIKWRIDGAPDSVFYGFKNPEIDDSYRNLSYKVYCDFNEIRSKIRNSKDKIREILCNPAKSYEIWHEEYFTDLIEAKLNEKNGLTYEEIIKVLKEEAQNRGYKLYSCVEKYEKLIVEKLGEKSNYPDTVIEELEQAKKELISYLHDLFGDYSKECKAAFLGDIRKKFYDENQKIRKEITSELNSINKQIEALNAYKKNSFSIKIKPVTFTVLD